MRPQFDVLATGNYSIDLIFTGLPRFPELGKDTLAAGFEKIPGEAYTTVVAMHRLGLAVGWAADFGNDDFSQYALACIRAEGLDESLFVHHKRPLRRISVAMSLPNERGFVTYYDPDPPIPAALQGLIKTSARVFYLPGLFYGQILEAGSKIVRLKHMKLVMDANSSDETLMNAAVETAIHRVDLLMPNAAEARRLTGEADLLMAIRRLNELCPLVVVKDGPNGSYACSQGEIWHAPGISITPIDTTGAGDCYNAGFIKAWLDGLPLVECLHWGNIVGGLSTLAMGGTAHKVTCALVQQLLMEQSHPTSTSDQVHTSKTV